MRDAQQALILQERGYAGSLLLIACVSIVFPLVFLVEGTCGCLFGRMGKLNKRSAEFKMNM